MHYIMSRYRLVLRFVFFFFFQAEDGIRDRDVTGVQTCALPIYEAVQARVGPESRFHANLFTHESAIQVSGPDTSGEVEFVLLQGSELRVALGSEIGRASCRERV